MRKIYLINKSDGKYVAYLSIIIQLIILYSIYVFARTEFIFIFSVISYIPSLVTLMYVKDKKLFFLSMLLLFISQHSLFLSAQPSWGYASGSDSINDLHVAMVLDGQDHFVFGEVGYGRMYYSYYPIMHIFTVILSKISLIPIMIIAKYIVPLLNVMITCMVLYIIYDKIVLDENIKRLSVLVFSLSWYYTLFYANFLREVYAFPLSLIIIYAFIQILNKNYKYIYVTYLLFLTLNFTHNYTSYMTIIIGTVLSIGYYIYEKESRGFYHILIMIIIVLVSTSEIFSDITITQILLTIFSFQDILQVGTISILPHRSLSERLISYSYYGILGLLSLIGILYLFYKKDDREEKHYYPFFSFFFVLFIISVLIRLSASGQWSYYLSRRATIWSFIGVAILTSYGLDYVSSWITSRTSLTRKNVTSILIIFSFCVLSIGKFYQFPSVISDSSIPQPVSYLVYEGATWLNDYSIDGNPILISHFRNASNSVARHMSPYTNLRPYNLDWLSYDNFGGYIPFVGPFYDQYLNDTSVDMIYSNGELTIGHKER